MIKEKKTKPRLTKYAESEYCILTHDRFKLYFTLVNQGGSKVAHSVSTSKLLYTDFKSSQLSKRSARVIGELLIKLADILEDDVKVNK